MERMTEELLATIEQLREENKKLKENLDIERRGHLQSARRVKQLEEENKKLKEELEWYREHYREKVDEEVLKGFGYNKKEIV